MEKDSNGDSNKISLQQIKDNHETHRKNNDVLVLMSTYNGEKYLRQQIDSILEQQDVVVKLLVRDDGSHDDTLSILDEYKAKGLLDYYQGKNLGPARSFMHLLQNAPASDYNAFAD